MGQFVKVIPLSVKNLTLDSAMHMKDLVHMMTKSLTIDDRKAVPFTYREPYRELENLTFTTVEGVDKELEQSLEIRK